MATRTDVRRAVAGILDEVHPWESRVLTPTSHQAGAFQSTVDWNAPEDGALYTGGFFYDTAGNEVYCTGWTAESTPIFSFRPGTTTLTGVVEFYRKFRPSQINTSIKYAFEALKPKLWVPVNTVWASKEERVTDYLTPPGWSHVYKVQYGAGPTVEGAEFDAFDSNGCTATWVPTESTWIRYVAVYVRNASTSQSQSITLGAASGSLPLIASMPRPQWVVIDLGKSYEFTSSTTLTLPSGLEYGVDEDGNAMYRLYKDQSNWQEILASDWTMEPDRYLRVKEELQIWPNRFPIPDKRLMRLLGLRYPVEPTEAATLEVPFDLLVNKVLYDKAVSRQLTGSLDTDAMDDKLRGVAAAYADSLARAVEGRPGSSKKIRDSL
jgi:hypothetical protein